MRACAMRNLVVACRTIMNEVDLAIAQTGVDYPVLLIESGLHDDTRKLGEALQGEIDRIDDVSNILMAFGYCGNALLGLKSRNARLIVPRADDCISLLLGSHEQRRTIADEMGTYFLTKGWV